MSQAKPLGVSRKDFRWLKGATEKEGLRVAKLVRAGGWTRAECQAEYDKHHDGEAAIALKWLDKWGIS